MFPGGQLTDPPVQPPANTTTVRIRCHVARVTDQRLVVLGHRGVSEPCGVLQLVGDYQQMVYPRVRLVCVVVRQQLVHALGAALAVLRRRPALTAHVSRHHLPATR